MRGREKHYVSAESTVFSLWTLPQDSCGRVHMKLYSLCNCVGLRDASPAVQQLILTALKALNDGSYLNLTGTSFQNAGWNLSYHLAQTNGLGLQGRQAVVIPLMHCLQASGRLSVGSRVCALLQKELTSGGQLQPRSQLTEQVQKLQDASSTL